MDKQTKDEIDRLVREMLKDGHFTSAPILIEDVLGHLHVHRKFYDLEDPTLLQKFIHKVQIGKQRIQDVVRKIKLAAVWLPDADRILVDGAQPKPKQEWASFHDAIHRLLPWHREFFLGDTAQTLEPYYQDTLEEEANYGASAVMFGGDLFTRQARDCRVGWSAVELLKKEHKKSYVTVLRRYVEHGRDEALAGMISTAWWDMKPEDQETRCRHFVRSSKFREQFPELSEAELLVAIDQHTVKKRGGPVGLFGVILTNSNGVRVEFEAESFYNGHYVLTLFAPKKLVHLVES